MAIVALLSFIALISLCFIPGYSLYQVYSTKPVTLGLMQLPKFYKPDGNEKPHSVGSGLVMYSRAELKFLY